MSHTPERVACPPVMASWRPLLFKILLPEKGKGNSNSHGARPVHRPLLVQILLGGEREFFVDNLLVRIHLIIAMVLADRPCAMGV